MTKIDAIFKEAFKMRNRLQGSNVTNKTIDRGRAKMIELIQSVNESYKYIDIQEWEIIRLETSLERFDRRDDLEHVIHRLITRNKPLWSKI